MNQRHLVILCGGEGKRLWPLATPEHPKQFLQWTDSTTLFDETVHRIEPLLNQGVQLHLVTQKKYRHFFKAYEKRVGIFFEEDVSRNTGPAILYVVNSIFNENNGDSVIFLPADHYFKDSSLFVEYLANMFDFLERERSLVAMGVVPSYPAIEYGYIETELTDAVIKKVIQFREKPDCETAHSFLKNPSMLWNVGVYGGRVSVFFEQFLLYQSELVRLMSLYCNNKISYSDLTNISFDYAVAEKTKELMVFEYKSEWSDVGSLDVFLNSAPLYKNNKILVSDIINKQHAA